MLPSALAAKITCILEIILTERIGAFGTIIFLAPTPILHQDFPPQMFLLGSMLDAITRNTVSVLRFIEK